MLSPVTMVCMSLLINQDPPLVICVSEMIGAITVNNNGYCLSLLTFFHIVILSRGRPLNVHLLLYYVDDIVLITNSNGCHGQWPVGPTFSKYSMPKELSNHANMLSCNPCLTPIYTKSMLSTHTSKTVTKATE